MKFKTLAFMIFALMLGVSVAKGDDYKEMREACLEFAETNYDKRFCKENLPKMVHIVNKYNTNSGVNKEEMTFVIGEIRQICALSDRRYSKSMRLFMGIFKLAMEQEIPNFCSYFLMITD